MSDLFQDVKDGDLDKIIDLIHEGQDINQENEDGSTALMLEHL